jgi:cell wall-associated NlpC family hydrolase
VPTAISLSRAAALLAVAALIGAYPLSAQDGIDIRYGRWWLDTPAETYAAAYHAPLLGPFDYGLGGYYLDDSRSPLDRTQTGAEVSLGLWRDGSGFYLVASTGLAMRHDDGNLDATWSAGAGYALGFLRYFSLGVELRYRVEDRWARGFWRLDPTDRRGFALAGRFSIRTSATPGGRQPTPTRPPSTRSSGGFEPPSSRAIATAANAGSVSDESAELSAAIVETALSAMGTPYRWGGTDSDGYDCSGLIQYAYGEHGILLPRVSRDQARLGVLVAKDVAALRPGDILGFAVSGSGVSHVGLYVGEGKFIHSSSTGVRLSSLTATDGDSRYWRQRWVSARRLLN